MLSSLSELLAIPNWKKVLYMYIYMVLSRLLREFLSFPRNKEGSNNMMREKKKKNPQSHANGKTKGTKNEEQEPMARIDHL